MDENVGIFDVATANATDNLGDELENAFLRRIIWQGKARVSLNDADSGEVFEIETLGNGLGADDDVDVTVSDFVVEGIQGIILLVISVEAGDLGGFKESFQFGFEELGAKTFVEDVWRAAFWTRMWHFFMVTAGVTDELVGVGMEGEWEETIWTEKFFATAFADGKRGRATTIMEDQSLAMII